MRYQGEGTPLVVIAGKEYGTGSSRDWAAKGTRLLGVKAVVAESFERIHRSNLIGMGVLPLQFKQGDGRASLGLTGEEIVDVRLPDGVSDIAPRQDVELVVRSGDQERTVWCRADWTRKTRLPTSQSGGILQFVLNNLVAEAG